MTSRQPPTQTDIGTLDESAVWLWVPSARSRKQPARRAAFRPASGHLSFVAEIAARGGSIDQRVTEINKRFNTHFPGAH